jgi:hypothetical protein
VVHRSPPHRRDGHCRAHASCITVQLFSLAGESLVRSHPQQRAKCCVFSALTKQFRAALFHRLPPEWFATCNHQPALGFIDAYAAASLKLGYVEGNPP